MDIAENPPFVTALGASAGGLDALREFFGAVVPDPRIAYVVVTHLSPTRESHLADLLDRCGILPAAEAVAGQTLSGGRVYVLPPGEHMGVRAGRFVPAPEKTATQPNRPIDTFMQSLAEHSGDRAVGVVLSGTDHDGTAGVKAIRAASGLTFAQVPASAGFPGMPDSALESGCVDHELSPRAMVPVLMAHVARLSGGPGSLASTDDDHRSGELDAVLALLLDRTSHDFREYRPGMLRRRLLRRMSIRGCALASEYLHLLESSDTEANALAAEFLIGVTDFFRDPELWAELDERALAPLVAARRAEGPPVRVWTPGCSTGEETYSIAMLLLERMGATTGDAGAQVFGTDIDLEALAVARRGRYRGPIESTVSAARIATFFDRVGDEYVVRRGLREAVLFAPQNMVRDTPFSRLDLVVCRNVLMYFEPALQARMVQLFHFALRPGGLLWVGPSEAVAAQSVSLFEPVSGVPHLYRRLGGRGYLPRGFASPAGTGWADPRRGAADRPPPDGELVRQHLAGRKVAAAVLVDRDGRALHFHGDLTGYLGPSGEATLDLLRLLRPELRPAVRAALRPLPSQAADAATRTLPAPVVSRPAAVSVQAEPVGPRGGRGLVLVVFTPTPVDAQADEPNGGARSGGDRLDFDLEESRRELARALEDTERSNDELRAAGEEASSLNEELQSANEELESSGEELQSLNEELSTVNAQLEDKAAELARSADDLSNLIDSTRIATVLLDRDLRVRRFTPAATNVFRLRAGDEGRLLTDVASTVADPDFQADAARVLDGENVPDLELGGGPPGTLLLRRLQPYHRAAGDGIDGVVASFIDIAALRDAQRQSRELMAVLEGSNDAVIGVEPDGRVVSWNAAAQRVYGWSSDDAKRNGLYRLVPPADQDAARDLLTRACRDGSAGPEAVTRRTRDGRKLQVSVTMAALRDERGDVMAVLSTERDITERLQSETEMRFRRLVDHIPTLLRVEDCAGVAVFVNRSCCEYIGRRAEQLVGHAWLEFVHPQDRDRYATEHAKAHAARMRLEIDLRLQRRDGQFRWMRSISVPYFDPDGQIAGFVALLLDVEDRRRAEFELVAADQRKDEFLAMLAHELRNPLAPIRNAARLVSTPGVDAARTAWAATVIDRQTATMASLLDGLLDVARIARGKLVLNLAPIELRVALERAVEVSQPLVDARRQKLQVALPPEDVVVEGDLERLTQVFANLLNNSAKYTPDAGQIEIRVECTPSDAIVRVTDDGAGMTAETLPIVFELFSQADRTLDRAGGGLGIGLKLVRQLVELHRGSVHAESAGPGQGSTFTVRLPRLLPPAGRPDGAASHDRGHPSEAGTADPTGAGRRVLVVDDNHDAAQSLAELLRWHGHEVSVAHDGHRAVDAALRTRPDVVLLDIGLPGMDGFQVARTMRGRSALAGMTLFALSGYGRPEDLTRATEAGFDRYFVKPADLEELTAAVAAAPAMARRAGGPVPPSDDPVADTEGR